MKAKLGIRSARTTVRDGEINLIESTPRRPRRQTADGTDGQVVRYTDRQTPKQTDKQTNNNDCKRATHALQSGVTNVDYAHHRPCRRGHPTQLT